MFQRAHSKEGSLLENATTPQECRDGVIINERNPYVHRTFLLSLSIRKLARCNDLLDVYMTCMIKYVISYMLLVVPVV